MRNHLRLLALALALFGGVLPAGASAAPLARPTDATLTQWVREALADDPRVDAQGVEVNAENGIVTLRGSVPTLAGKRYGLLAAQRIHGVLGVVDQVDVEAETRPDADILRDAKRRIRRSPGVASRGVVVGAKGGTVTLTGEVASWSQRFQAQLLVSEVRGVRLVDNQLTIEPGSVRSDAEIGRDVEAALHRDAYLVGLPIKVVVKDGVVELSGKVSAPYEKTRAGTQAGWVSNVRSVKNSIRVEWMPNRSSRVAAPTVSTDEALAKAVKEELLQDDRIDASEIEASAAYGHVTLRGRVASERQRSLASEDARNVVGVARVTNQLRVVFVSRPDDEVRAEIEEVFAGDSALFENAITVQVKGGVVTLAGDVGGGYHRAHAAAIASRTVGVREVINRLRTMLVTSESGADLLQREIEQRLKRHWRTSPVAGRISVDVENGVVTLSGDVDRLAERNAAGRIARRTPGVRRVHNELAVDAYPYPWEEPLEEDEELPDWQPQWDDSELPSIA